jgi:ADP-ribose pyrophosphatase
VKPKPWKRLSSRVVYENPWMHLREDVAELPDGRTTIYGVVTFGECVGVVPFVDDDHVLLVRQYRYVQGENHRWEIPTGGVHEGETLSKLPSANWPRKRATMPGA